jgi:hypothetical protein
MKAVTPTILLFLLVGCALKPSRQPKADSKLPSTCVIVTNAINHEDWAALRKLTKPGMLANNYGKSFEAEINQPNPTSRMHVDYVVGKFLMVQRKVGADGKTNKVYSFQLENKNGTVNPHWLQITVREEYGRSELVDFWNFGW